MERAEKRGRGRPPKEVKMSHVGHFRLTEEEAAKLTTLAAKLGVSEGEAVRRAIGAYIEAHGIL